MPSSGEAARAALEMREARRAARLAREAASTANTAATPPDVSATPNPPGTPPASGAATPPNSPRVNVNPAAVALQQVYRDEAKARIEAALNAEIGFVERLTWFWSNHFCVSVAKNGVRPLAGAYEREAIRPHVLGRFHDMLLAVENPSGDVDLSRQRPLDRPQLASRREPRERLERESRPRNPRIAHPRRTDRLHAGRRHRICENHHGLDSRAGAARACWRVHVQSAHA